MLNESIHVYILLLLYNMNISIDCITTVTNIMILKGYDNNNERHKMDKNEKGKNHVDENVVKVIKEDVRHSLELSSFHDDSHYAISRCSNDDDSSCSSNDSSCCSSSSSDSCDDSFARYEDDDDHHTYDPIDAIENWSIDTSTSHDDNDDDDLSTTSYCYSSSSSSSSSSDAEQIKNYISSSGYSLTSNSENKAFTTMRDSIVLLDHPCNFNLSNKSNNNKNRTDVFIQSKHEQQQPSLTKTNKHQHDVMMKQPWRTKSNNDNCNKNHNINNRSIAVDDKNDINHSVIIMEDNIKQNNVLSTNNNFDEKVRQRHHRVVSFDTNIYVQEYNVTVGAYSSVDDTCPLQLTWEHTPIQILPFNNGKRQRQHSPNRLRSPSLSLSYQSPYRMNIRERRQRIATCNHITVHDVYMLEQQMILWQIQDALQHNHQIMIHSLHFQDNDDVEPPTTSMANDTQHTDCDDKIDTLSAAALYQHQYQDVVWHKKQEYEYE